MTVVRTLPLLFCLSACASEPTAEPESAAPAEPVVERDRPVDDVVTVGAATSDPVFVLRNDPAGLRLVGIGEPTGGSFGFPADGLPRGVVTFEAPAAPGESSVTYYTSGADSARDSARIVVRVE